MTQLLSNPSGTWAWSYDYGQGEVKSVLTLQVKDKKVAGVYHSEEEKIEVKGGIFNGQGVAFNFDVVRTGQEKVTVTIAGVQKDANIDTLSALVDGQAHQCPLEGLSSTRLEDVLGNWELTSTADNRAATWPARSSPTSAEMPIHRVHWHQDTTDSRMSDMPKEAAEFHVP